jgi:hypothetical protein
MTMAPPPPQNTSLQNKSETSLASCYVVWAFAATSVYKEHKRQIMKLLFYSAESDDMAALTSSSGFWK